MLVDVTRPGLGQRDSLGSSMVACVIITCLKILFVNECEHRNRPVSYSQLPLITMTIDSFLQCQPQLDVKSS